MSSYNRVRIGGTEKVKESPLPKHTSKAKAIYNLLYSNICYDQTSVL